MGFMYNWLFLFFFFSYNQSEWVARQKRNLQKFSILYAGLKILCCHSLIMQLPWSQAPAGCIWELNKLLLYATVWNKAHAHNPVSKRGITAALFLGWAPCLSQLGRRSQWKRTFFTIHSVLGDSQDRIKISQLGTNKWELQLTFSSGNLQEDCK